MYPAGGWLNLAQFTAGALQIAERQELQNHYRRWVTVLSAEPHPPQGQVLNEAEVEAESPVNGDAACEPETSDGDVATLAANDAENSEPGKAKNRRPCLPQILSRKVITITLPPELELIPAHVPVTHYVREKYRCRCGEQHGTTGRVKVAPVDRY